VGKLLLSVPGVDMVNFGATDYSVSVGVPGQDGRPGTQKHRLVEEAELKVITTALRMGIQPRVEMSFLDEETMLEYQRMGVKHWCMGPDTVVWFDYLNKQVSRCRHDSSSGKENGFELFCVPGSFSDRLCRARMDPGQGCQQAHGP
jgi:2-keto-3-deoxy-L-rhamnonate aldolase RhmA